MRKRDVAFLQISDLVALHEGQQALRRKIMCFSTEVSKAFFCSIHRVKTALILAKCALIAVSSLRAIITLRILMSGDGSACMLRSGDAVRILVGPAWLSFALNHVLEFPQVLFIGHVPLGLGFFECFLNLLPLFNFINDVERALPGEEIRATNLENHAPVELLLKEAVIDERYQLMLLDGLKMSHNLLLHVHTLLFL